eukprot:gene6220-12601_t
MQQCNIIPNLSFEEQITHSYDATDASALQQCTPDTSQNLVKMESTANMFKVQIQTLLDKGLFDSAEILSGLLISAISSSTSTDCSEAFELFADALYAKQEFKRALDYYLLAFQNRKSNTNLSRARVNRQTIESEIDAYLKLKECQCRIQLKDSSIALRELETIPQKYRDVRIHCTLGKLYKSNNLRRHAITSYKDALQQMPTAMEVIEALISLGVDSKEILALIDDICEKNPLYNTLFAGGWLTNIINALSSRNRVEFRESEAAFKITLQDFPKNIYLLNYFGKIAIESEYFDDAQQIFRQIKTLDDKNICGMDLYGQVLHYKEDSLALNRLASDLLNIDNKRPQGWIVAAMYSELKNDNEKSLVFIDKAIQLDPRHALSYRLKGQLLLERQRPEQAIISLFQATSIEKDVATLAALVQAHIALSKASDAVAAAKEAMALMPRSPTAMFMFGTALATTKEGQKEAIRIFRKILLTHPLHKGTITSLSLLLSAQGKNDEAIACLTTALDRKACPQLRIQLGKLYSRMGRNVDALAQLNTAVSHSVNLNESAEAIQELERVERILRGEDSVDNDMDAPSSGRHLSVA